MNGSYGRGDRGPFLQILKVSDNLLTIRLGGEKLAAIF